LGGELYKTKKRVKKKGGSGKVELYYKKRNGDRREL
jgi:hypothetical protein